MITSDKRLVPVAMNETSTTKDLIKMMVPGHPSHCVVCLHRGRILVPGITLTFQNVKDGDTIVIYEQSSDENKRPTRRRSSFLTSLYSVMCEAQRLSDQDMIRMEMTSDRWVLEESDSDDEPFEVLPTVLTDKATKVSDNPLPSLVSKPDSDGLQQFAVLKPYFSSIEGAGEFFLKQIQDEWFW